MWVVIAKKGLDIHRDDLISELLEEKKTKQEEYYVVKSNTSYKYNVSSSISSAKIYKQRSSCERLIKKFQSAQKDVYNSPYYWIREYHLSTKKVSFEEWNLICNQELSKLDRIYEYNKRKIEIKRKSFK